AIEAVVIYNYFMSRLQRTSLELKLMAEEFVELLREQPAAPAKSAEKGDAPKPIVETKPAAQEA
ncbi:MAG TPA: MotA/TolQ/ExbB proton channel family protein, partial [Polyangia bacterium]|nr:MotA/TolQ/ExbB proton channel family protein [Polyangia bacterium]